MRRILALFAVIHLVFMGCTTSQNPASSESEGGNRAEREQIEPSPPDPDPLLTFWVDTGEVRVISYEQDSLNRQLVVNLLHLPTLGNTEELTLIFKETLEENDLTYNSAKLCDYQQSLLFGFEFEWSAPDSMPNWFAVTEYTLMDTLRIRHSNVAGIITETYTYKGESREYACLAPAKSTARMAPVKTHDPLPPLRQKAVEELQQWSEVFAPENTLNYNAHGELMALILTNEDFNTWAESEFTDRDLSKPCIDAREKVCTIAAIVAFKCYGFGLMNPFCIAAVGVSIACILGSVGRWIHGWR